METVRSVMNKVTTVAHIHEQGVEDGMLLLDDVRAMFERVLTAEVLVDSGFGGLPDPAGTQQKKQDKLDAALLIVRSDQIISVIKEMDIYCSTNALPSTQLTPRQFYELDEKILCEIVKSPLPAVVYNIDIIKVEGQGEALVLLGSDAKCFFWGKCEDRGKKEEKKAGQDQDQAKAAVYRGQQNRCLVNMRQLMEAKVTDTCFGAADTHEFMKAVEKYMQVQAAGKSTLMGQLLFIDRGSLFFKRNELEFENGTPPIFVDMNVLVRSTGIPCLQPLSIACKNTNSALEEVLELVHPCMTGIAVLESVIVKLFSTREATQAFDNALIFSCALMWTYEFNKRSSRKGGVNLTRDGVGAPVDRAYAAFQRKINRMNSPATSLDDGVSLCLPSGAPHLYACSSFMRPHFEICGIEPTEREAQLRSISSMGPQPMSLSTVYRSSVILDGAKKKLFRITVSFS